MKHKISNKYNLIISKLRFGSYKAFFNEPLSKHSSWRIGGFADVVIEPNDENCIQTICYHARDNNIPFIVIGKGSNLLFDKKGFNGIVIKLGRQFSCLSINNTLIKADAGIFLPKLAYKAAQCGLTGIEHTCGIPGTLGGLVFMNGGSLNQSIGQNVEAVEVLDSQGNKKIIQGNECGFAYRKSIFQDNQYTITNILLRCKIGHPAEIRVLMKYIIRERREKFPLTFPSCGSVFKIDETLLNTYGSPGKIIDDAGFKGYRVGDAEVSSKHANFIINRGNATSDDVISLVKKIYDYVHLMTNRYLKCEVRYVKPDGLIKPLHEFL